jgi:hypothetical protein
MNYEVANEHLMHRLTLREHTLMVYIAAVGTVFSVAFSEVTDFSLLLSLPFVALGVTVLVAHHNLMIGALIQFCSDEIEPHLKELGEAGPQFDTSKTFQRYGRAATRFSSFGQSVVLLVPCIVALGANSGLAFQVRSGLGWLWWFSVVCTILSLVVLLHTHGVRSRGLPQKAKS